MGLTQVQVYRAPGHTTWAVFVTAGLLACCLISSEAAAPTFDNISGATVLTVDEDAAFDTTLVTVTTSEADGDTPITLSVNDTAFGFDGDVLKVKGALDYESRTSYSLEITATDNAAESDSVVITVNVLDKNDHDPTLTLTTVDLNLAEEQPAGTTVPFVFSGSDTDTNDGTSLTYSLSGSESTVFNINPTTGAITLNTKVDVDPNTANQVYKPLLTVSDGTRSATATLTMTITDTNDNSPTCSPSIVYKTVVEETSGSTVYTLTCTDRDSSFENNNQLMYSVNSTNFSVDGAGAVSVLSAVDYEAQTSVQLLVTVADNAAGGTLETTATIEISISPANDNDPVWGTFIPAPTGDTYTRDENIAVGTSLFTMVATDADVDTGNTITYSIQSVTDGTNPVTGLFNVDSSTGEVTTLASLDRDAGVSEYTLNLQATDGGTGTHIISQTVKLALNDVNDIAPVFQETPIPLVTIAESSAKTGSVVTTVSASDGDVTAASFTYQVAAIVAGGTTTSDWAFDGVTLGQLEFATDLDLDSGDADYHILRLTVTDGGAPVLTGTTSVTVSISPDNEFTPTISSEPSGTVSVDEDETVGTGVATVTGADSDTGDEGQLTYSITGGNTGSAFTIDASTGEIKTQTALDRETLDNYDLEITIADSGVSQKSVTTSVSISVADANDNQPSCTSLFIAINPAENTATGITLTTLTCSDADPADTLTYTVRSPHDTQFGFNTPVDALKLLTPFDYDSATQSYLVVVDVSDGVNSQAVTVSIDLDPVNEAPPSFSTDPTVPVTENAVSNPIITYTADDTDFSPHDVTSYAINTVSNSGASLFGIDSSTGAISLRQALDYDTLPAGDKTYELEIIATDGGGQTGTGTVTVSVVNANDNAPVCSQNTYTVNLDETQSGPFPFTVVSNLGCSDVEDGTTLTYSLSQTPGSHFAVASNAVTLTSNTLDYESATQHTLTITVSDAGTPTAASTTVTVYVNVINLNDGGPVFASLVAKDIDENLAIGQSVVDVVAVDPDGSDAAFGDVQYSILSGDANNQFAIDASTGEITVRKALDFETTPTYSLVIRATERGGTNSADATQVINLNDVNDEWPACTSYSFTETVSENAVADDVIRALGCTDADAGTTLTYTITSGDTSLFKVEGGSLKVKAPLDFETDESHALTIQVSDGDASHNRDITGTVSVGSVDEGQPVFTQTIYNVDVSESETSGHLVTTVVANDPDSNSTADGQVTYAFVSTYSDFVLDQASGEITLAQQLDRETVSTHTLLVKAEDATGSNTATVSVTVQDANDNTPVFQQNPYTGSLTEGDSTGTTVATVSATDDDDTGNNYGVVTYALTGSSDFSVGPSSGVITNTAVLSADSGTVTYTLTVTATDSGGGAGALTGTTVVVVTVNTMNGNDPVFTSSTTSVTIQETVSIGDVIATVTATDADTGTDGDLTFAFVSAQTKFSLSQRGDECDLRLEQNLDFESGDTTFSVEIVATDGGVPARSATGTVDITVDDVNDNSPLCTSVVNVDKNEGQTNIATLVCSDADAGTTLTYTVDSTTPNTITPSVSSTGVVTVSPALDYETDTYYVIKIRVEDDGVPQKSTTVTLNLIVNDLNDNDPTLTGPFTFTVLESATAGNTVYYTATASSNDGPDDTLTFSLSDTTYFDITSDTGVITLKTQAPDAETVGLTYNMDLCVEDLANPTARSACQTMTITVTDENDVTPVFNPASYTGTVAENDGTGTNLATAVTATDSDASAAFKSITYSIISGNTGNAFAINPSTGVVSVDAALDFSVTSSYTLVIQASDGTNTATANYNIQVTSANLNDPVFSQSTETVAIDEDASVGDPVPYTATASDADSEKNGELTYSISAGPFSINPSTGAISVAGSLDRETDTSYTVTVQAVDGGDTPRTGELTLTIDINDVNDETPSCSKSLYSASVPEDASGGEAVATLVCTDDDDDPNGLNNDLTYTLSTGDPLLFDLDTSGVMTVAAGAFFDRFFEPNYELIVDVVDKSSGTKLTFTAAVTVTITDVNDNAPYFLSLPSTSEPEDIAVGTTVAVVVALDDDEGDNAELVYAIQSGNTDDTFSIDSVTGELILLKALDYDTPPTQYDLVITVADKGVPDQTTTGTLTFSVNDVSDEPILCGTSLYSATTPENAQGTFLDVAVSCTKADGIAAGLIEYTITAGNEDGNFELDFITGDLYTTAGASIDYENTTSYFLTVTAAEGGETTNVSIQITVTDVNEFSPECTPAGPYAISVSEDAAIGYTVTVVNGTDGDTVDTVQIYTITSGNSEGKFRLDSSTGVLQVQGALDREVTPSYSLTLTVADSGGNTGSVVVNIAVDDVNDNAPTCTETSAVVTVDEGDTSASYVPNCDDPDTVASPILDYSISAGDHPSISINSSTGELYLDSALDYETNTSLVVTIEVSDLDTPTPRTATVQVTFVVNPVNEHDPVFTPSGNYGPISVDENESIGTSVAQVTASDADEGSDHGAVSFAIVSGDDAQQFAIDASSGIVSVAKALDRETTASYELVVRATDETAGDAGQRSATATVSITVVDVNDLSPTFNPSVYSIDVLETASSGPAVVLQTLTVTDGDEGANGAVTLTITSGNDQGKFSISGNDVILSAGLDYENTTSYDLVITATDGGTPPLTGIARLFVNVLAANEVAPLMSASSASVDISEETPVGTLVYDANATDTDTGGSDGTITYNITSGVTGNEFTIDSSTGQLYVGSQLDFDTAPTSYAIIISAEDGAGLSASTSTVSLSITLTDENDNVPQFSTSQFTFNVDEGVPSGTLVGTVVVTDDDSGVNGDVTLEITGGSGSAYFNIDPDSYEVTTVADIDYENFDVFYLSLKASDGGTPPLTSAGLVKIDVVNMNDNDPVITPAQFAVTISEGAVSGASVYTFTATDEDTAIGGLSLVDPSALFEIDSATGLVTTKAALDRETADTHTLRIRAVDLPTSGDPATVRSSTATLTIIVEDENDNDPTITGSYSPSIAENSALNTQVFAVTASDPDDGANGQLTYAITAGNTGGAFSIDSQGKVLVAVPLDRETTSSYTLTIVVSDQGTPPRTDQIDVTVTIDDVNDNDPIEIQSTFTFSVEEDSSIGTSVGDVVATDSDAGSNAVLIYTLDSFSVGNGSHFQIDTASGEITVADDSLDRETQAMYQATVKVTDSGVTVVRTTFATVIINIDDLNDNAPIFTQASYTGSVAEDADNDTMVVTVVATDADAGANADITYTMDTSLLNGAVASTLFEVDASTGEIRPYATLDYETYQRLTFVVEAADGGVPSLTDTATVTVSITDVNDQRPVFSPKFYNTEVAYDGTCASILATVSASDGDSGNNGLITYSLQTTAFDFLFSVDGTWGALTITSVASPTTSYHLEIQATDAGSPSTKSASTPATVRVDAFVPNSHVVTIRLAISRVDFVAQQSTFLADLQTHIRNTYPTALVRLWCLTEYEGTAVSPPSGRRRLLADQPVDVNTIVLQDDSTDSEANLGNDKTLLTQDELLALVSNLEGSTWDYYQIVSVSEYYQSTDGWFDTLYGKIITAIACFLALVFICLLIYMAAEACCGNGFRRTPKKPKRSGSPKISKVEPRVELDSLPPSRASTAQSTTKPLKPFWDNNWASIGLTDALADEDLPSEQPASVPPPYSRDEEVVTPVQVKPVSPATVSLPRTPRSVFFSESETPPSAPASGSGKPEFDGRALDHATGKVYEYNTKTNERRWIQS